jgi:hypothetical protein
MEVRARMDRPGLPGARYGALVLGALAAVALWLALTPVASASTSFIWTGGSESTESWSAPANWEGDTAPAASQTLTALEFPHLTSGACETRPSTDACYFSVNDLSGLSSESIRLDDSDGYLLEGEGITLGSGGITATPAATGGVSGTFMAVPLRLSAPQRWSIANRSGGQIEEDGLLLGEEVTGASPLTIELDRGPALVLENDTEVGPLKIEGPNASGEHIDNGSVIMAGGKLNATDHEPVELSRVYFEGAGTVGPLTVNDATLVVGGDTESPGGLAAASAKIDPDGGALFSIGGEGTTAQVNYSQLTSTGPIELSGAIAVVVNKPSKAGACATLTQGEKYTFISTTGQLSGVFANAPEGGPEITVGFAKGCAQQSRTMRISYLRSGGTETVTGTVEAQAKEQQEAAQALATQEAAAAQRHAEEAAAKLKAETTAHDVAPVGKVSKPKPLTRAQLLARGLKQCRKQPKKKRAKCEAQVRRKYGAHAKQRRKH